MRKGRLSKYRSDANKHVIFFLQKLDIFSIRLFIAMMETGTALT